MRRFRLPAWTPPGCANAASFSPSWTWACRRACPSPPGTAMGSPDAERRPVGRGGAHDADNVKANGSAPYGLHMFPQHAALLKASAIMPEVARARGYVSVDTKRRLEPCGFARYQRRTPGLLLPLHRADTSVWGYQYRPDIARKTKAGTV